MRSRRVPEVVPNASELSSASPGVELGYFRQRSGTSGSARALPAALGYFRPFPALLRCQVRKTAILELSRSGFICAEKGEIEGRNWAVGSRGEHLSGKMGLLDQKKKRGGFGQRHCAPSTANSGGFWTQKGDFSFQNGALWPKMGMVRALPTTKTPKNPQNHPKCARMGSVCSIQELLWGSFEGFEGLQRRSGPKNHGFGLKSDTVDPQMKPHNPQNPSKPQKHPNSAGMRSIYCL